jgi:hypothetical protein
VGVAVFYEQAVQSDLDIGGARVMVVRNLKADCVEERVQFRWVGVRTEDLIGHACKLV